MRNTYRTPEELRAIGLRRLLEHFAGAEAEAIAQRALQVPGSLRLTFEDFERSEPSLSNDEADALIAAAILQVAENNAAVSPKSETPPASAGDEEEREGEAAEANSARPLDAARVHDTNAQQHIPIQARHAANSGHRSSTAPHRPYVGQRKAVAAATKPKDKSLQVAEFFEGEAITISGISYLFVYTEQPRRLYLKGSLPSGVGAFQAGGRRWPLRGLEGRTDLHAIDELTQVAIDGFNGAGSWVD